MSKYPLLRQPGPDEPLTVKIHGYHTTLTDNWLSIRRTGLIPGRSKPSGQDWLGRWSGKGIYYHQRLPEHEIDSSFDTDTGEPTSLTIEVEFNIPPGYVVPDEDSGLSPDEALKALHGGDAIAVGYPVKPAYFTTVHLADTPAARQWAAENVRHKVEFHPVGFRAKVARVVARHLASLSRP